MEIVVEDPRPLTSETEMGLLHKEFDNSQTLRTGFCPQCGNEFEFDPEAMKWNRTGVVEYTSVECGDCQKKFDICANPMTTLYDFYFG